MLPEVAGLAHGTNALCSYSPSLPSALLRCRVVCSKHLDDLYGASQRVRTLDVDEELHHPSVRAGAGACVWALAAVERPVGAAVSDDSEGLLVVVRQGDEADSAALVGHGDGGSFSGVAKSRGHSGLATASIKLPKPGVRLDRSPKSDDESQRAVLGATQPSCQKLRLA